ncbi:MAG TPA: glycosyltransferase family 2 protein [Chthoniobacter sp.]|nr:glycosyltransferase family 2 protein [Chthoniobacter sp.]
MSLAPLAICSICHPPYLHYLPEHLSSLERALRDRGYPVHILVSEIPGGQQQGIRELFEKCGSRLKIDLSVTEHSVPVGRARNILFQRTAAEWVTFLDFDTTVDGDFIEHLEQALSHAESDVGAIGGSLGIWKASRVGVFEAYMDIIAYMGKLGRTRSDFARVFEKTIAGERLARLETESVNWPALSRELSGEMRAFEGHDLGYLQGYNQTIRSDSLARLNGFNPAYKSAEDRDMATRIRRLGQRVVFNPKGLVLHDYTFSRRQIMRRKLIHGAWSSRYRRDHRDRPDLVPGYGVKEWMRYAATCLSPPPPFANKLGIEYYRMAFVSYAAGCVLDTLGSVYEFPDETEHASVAS